MKKIYILTLLMSLFLSGSEVMAAGFSKAPSRENLKTEKRNHVKTRSADFEAPVTDIITKPEGAMKFYDKESAGTFVLGGYLSLYKDTFPAIIYWADNGDVYFKNLISVFPDEYYLKGTFSDNIITLPVNQTVENVPEEGYAVNFGVFKTVPKTVGGEEVYDFELAPEVESISFNVYEDGSLEMVLPCEPFNGEDVPEYVAGFYYTDDLTFLGYSDFMQKYTKLDLDIVTIPSGATVEQYVYVDSYGYAAIVDVAFYNDELYIRGLSNQLPEGTIKAQVDGDKAYVAQNEYLGIYFDIAYIFTRVLYNNPDYDGDIESDPFIFAPEDVMFELNIDRINREIYADNQGVYLSFHGDMEDVFNSLGLFDVFVLKYQESFAGTPANPIDPEYTTEWAPYQGFNDFFFTLSNSSIEGTLLDVEKLYYKVYVNGTPMIFHQENILDLLGEETVAYKGVPIEVELMPYLFDNGNDIYKMSENAFDIGIYTDDVRTIGVQAVYYFDNEFTYSEIVSVAVSDGVDGPKVEGRIVSQEYYTLDGRRIADPAKGIFIEKIKTESGKVISRKVVK